MKDARKPFTTKDPTETQQSTLDCNQNGIILHFTPKIPTIPSLQNISKKCWQMNPRIDSNSSPPKVLPIDPIAPRCGPRKFSAAQTRKILFLKKIGEMASENWSSPILLLQFQAVNITI
jgi:hypothetical protein